MNIYQKRRQKLIDQLQPYQAMVFFAEKPVHKSADGEYEFDAKRNYYYLTGINEPEGVLLLYKTATEAHEVLYIRKVEPTVEKWIGRFIQPESASLISGVARMDIVANFESNLSLLINRAGIDTVYVDIDRQQLGGILTQSDELVTKLRQYFPTLTIKDGFKLVAKMRCVKDEHEIEAIKAAIALTNQGIERAVKCVAPGKYEYEIMAEFLYELNKHNAVEMFDTIMASGANGVILHYVENNAQMQDQDLVLFDLGAKLNHYGADISRTYPVNGKFSERQKLLYNIVLGAMKEVTKAVRPGVTLAQLNQIVIDFYADKLTEIGLIQDQSEVSNYFYHGVGHVLGLDTHDVGYVAGMPLEEGFVITNEPGLYIAQENIGIRLETDLLVTADGCIDLGADIKIEVEDIERLMRGEA